MSQVLDLDEMRAEVNVHGVLDIDQAEELLDELKSLRTRFSAMRAGRDFERSRADKNAHKLKQAERKVAMVLELANVWETGALRWEEPLPVPREVFHLREALQQPTHEPEWSDYQPCDDGPACSCGYNGPYKECWQSRRALDGDGRG